MLRVFDLWYWSHFCWGYSIWHGDYNKILLDCNGNSLSPSSASCCLAAAKATLRHFSLIDDMAPSKSLLCCLYRFLLLDVGQLWNNTSWTGSSSIFTHAHVQYTYLCTIWYIHIYIYIVNLCTCTGDNHQVFPKPKSEPQNLSRKKKELSVCLWSSSHSPELLAVHPVLLSATNTDRYHSGTRRLCGAFRIATARAFAENSRAEPVFLLWLQLIESKIPNIWTPRQPSAKTIIGETSKALGIKSLNLVSNDLKQTKLHTCSITPKVLAASRFTWHLVKPPLVHQVKRWNTKETAPNPKKKWSPKLLYLSVFAKHLFYWMLQKVPGFPLGLSAISHQVPPLKLDQIRPGKLCPAHNATQPLNSFAVELVFWSNSFHKDFVAYTIKCMNDCNLYIYIHMRHHHIFFYLVSIYTSY